MLLKNLPRLSIASLLAKFSQNFIQFEDLEVNFTKNQTSCFFPYPSDCPAAQQLDCLALRVFARSPPILRQIFFWDFLLHCFSDFHDSHLPSKLATPSTMTHRSGIDPLTPFNRKLVPIDDTKGVICNKPFRFCEISLLETSSRQLRALQIRCCGQVR